MLGSVSAGTLSLNIDFFFNTSYLLLSGGRDSHFGRSLLLLIYAEGLE